MTAIAALIDKGKVYIGGDSAGVAGFSLETRKDEKVFVNHGMIIGFTTSFRMGNILQWSFTPPKKSANMSDEKYMNTTFINAVREAFRKCGYLNNVNGREDGGCFVVGYNKSIYVVESDFQIAVPLNPFTAVGCGRDICLGSLYTSEGAEPKVRITMALKAAQMFSAGVREPFVIKNI